MSSNQLELFSSAPWAVRLKVPESLQLWWDNDWIHTAKSKTTKGAFKRICMFWSSRYQDELSGVDMEALVRHMQQLGLGNAAVNTTIVMVTRWQTWLRDCKNLGTVHGIDFRPMTLPAENIGSAVSKLRETPRDVAWSKRVVQKLLAVCQQSGDRFMADVIAFLYITKLRPGDVWEVTDKNVDLPHLILFGVQHKSISRRRPVGKPYTKPITPHLEAIIRRRLDQAWTGGFLFRDPTFTHEAWRRKMVIRFAEIRKAAGLPHVQMRDMRPSAATLELDNGVDSLTVSQGLEHADQRMLPVYARRNLHHKREAQLLLEDSDSEILQ